MDFIAETWNCCQEEETSEDDIKVEEFAADLEDEDNIETFATFIMRGKEFFGILTN